MNNIFKNLNKFLLSFIAIVSLVSISISPSFAALSTAGPLNPTTTFPSFYSDGTLSLDLMEAADPFGISAPVEASPFSQQIGFGAEGFWWSADATVPTAAGQALLVLAIEAAFPNSPTPTDGDQAAFGRVRIRVDVSDPGTYVVTYPYGQKTYNVTTPGTRAINDTVDIGCFSQIGVFKCDQAGVPNYSSVLVTEIGPFLTWDTFNINPALQDPQLINTNPTYATRIYVGNPNVPHAVTGSPTGNNLFRVTGPNIGGTGVNTVETNLFTVSGRLAATTDTTAPVITVTGANPASVNVGGVYTDQGATATDNVDGDITANIVTTGLPINTTAAGTFTVTYTVTDAAGNVGTATRTVNVIAGPVDTVPPVITLNGVSPIDVLQNSVYDATTDQGATCTDNIDTTCTVIETGLPVDTTTLGAKTVTYNATDTAGNTAVPVTRTINVVATPPPPVTAPTNRPTNVTGTQTANGVVLSWNDTNTNESEFQISRATRNRGPFTQIGTAGVNATTFTDTTAPRGTVYYRVQACNTAGCSRVSATARVVVRNVPIPQPQPPTQNLRTPSNLRASNTTGGVQLSWRDRSTGETEFKILRRVGNAPFTQIGTSPADSTSFTDAAAPTGRVSYRVQACSTTECSPQSNVANVRIR